MPLFSRSLIGVVTALILVCTPLTAALAQTPASSSARSHATVTRETIELLTGDIFEIMPVHDIPDPVYAWILTQNGEFTQAVRSPVFRYRFIQPGSYLLRGDVTSADKVTTVKKEIAINVKARERGAQMSSAGTASGTTVPADAIVMTDPPAMQDGTVVLRVNQQVLKLSAVNPDLTPLSVDLNTEADGNGDGDPDNDVDNVGTFFQSDATPLYVWFVRPVERVQMAATAIASDGSAIVQDIDVVSREYARTHDMLSSPAHITMRITGNREYEFGVAFEEQVDEQLALLYHWDFGDGQESLLTTPSHIFPSDGTYTVTLEIRNLTSGAEVATDAETVTVAGNDGSATSAPSSAGSTSSENDVSGTGSTLRWILLMIAVFIGCLGAGLLVVFLLSKLRKGKPLDQRFAEMEKNLTKKDEVVTQPAAPLAIMDTTATAAPAPRPVQTPSIDEKNAPAWLTKGLKGEATPATPAPATPSVQKPAPAVAPAPVMKPATPTPPPAPKPAPAPVAPPTQPVPTPAPATPAPKPQQPADATDAALPPWLRPDLNAQAGTTATPATPPAPVTPAPAPIPKSAPPVAAAAPTPVVTQTPAAPAAKPVVPPAPAPAPVQKPAAPVTPPAPAPATPAPVAPKPTPAPVPAPKPAAPAAAPVQPPVAPPAAKPVTPATPAATPPPAAPQTPAKEASDQPIGFIRVDSLDQNGNPPPAK